MSEFHVEGGWRVFQSNGFHVDFEIEQEGRQIEGKAEQSDGTHGEGGGKVKGDQFHLRIIWDNGSIGVYNGTFGLDGFLTGVTFDEKHPENVANWRSNTNFVQ